MLPLCCRFSGDQENTDCQTDRQTTIVKLIVKLIVKQRLKMHDLVRRIQNSKTIITQGSNVLVPSLMYSNIDSYENDYLLQDVLSG